jgi:hypothetical protein
MATLLALPAVVALGLAWAEVGRPPRDSYAAVLDQQRRWVEYDYEDFDRPERRDVPCVLKVSYSLSDPRPYDPKTHPFIEMDVYGMWSLSDEGEGRIRHRWGNGISNAVGSHPMPAGALAALRPVLANMPPSDRDIPDGKFVAIGFRGPRGWEARVYDRTKLAPPLAKALAAAGITLPP